MFTILFYVGFCTAAMRKAESSLCTQFLLTLKMNLSLQLVGETDMQGNEKEKINGSHHFFPLEVICYCASYD